ncbi:DUF1002 domain-containing protein [Clostridium massiliamazoniense]|uniref:DUF1002 domain-containing protein n=1 Tax=Clostridium massiliamazoniense TaxID=1347366 RepID=UPI0006D819A1|nr:DUF1002 domain-containing protein [Clostridium massiliamazoniense]
MKNKRLVAIIAVALTGAMGTLPSIDNTGSKIENVRLLDGGSISTTVNNNGGNNNTTVNNTVNNGANSSSTENSNTGSNNNTGDNNKVNQTKTPASSQPGYKPGQIIVTLGANLTYPQREQMLKDFGVTTNEKGVKFVSTTNYDIAVELGLSTTHISPTSQSISSTKVTLLPAGSGISVSTNNLTQVTGDMLASALVTCGITDASIVANAPYPVTGQAALAGILQGFQDVTGTTIPEANKKVANDEVNVTTSLGQSIGQQKAEQVVTQAKKDVVDQKPQNLTQVINIVNNVTNNNGVTLSEAQKQELTNLMVQIKDLNLNANKVNSTLNAIQNSINNGKKDFSNVSKAISDEYNKLKNEGFFTKIGNWFKDVWHDICSLFDGGNKNNNENSTNNSNSNSTNNSGNNSASTNGTTGNTNTENTSNNESTTANGTSNQGSSQGTEANQDNNSQGTTEGSTTSKGNNTQSQENKNNQSTGNENKNGVNTTVGPNGTVTTTTGGSTTTVNPNGQVTNTVN